MKVKETPTTWGDYYRKFKEDYTKKLEKAREKLEKLGLAEGELYEQVKEDVEKYKTEFGINIYDYDDFVNNEYSKGDFMKAAKGVFINKQDNYQLVTEVYSLYDLAQKQKQIYDLFKEINLYNKCVSLASTEYRKIIKSFYTEVQKQLILKGNGYPFEGKLGWICVNRTKLLRSRPLIDFKATEKRKQEIIENGGRIWNKEEYDFCYNNGIEYNAEDPRVYLNKEYAYEIPLINCRITEGTKYRLDITDRTPPSLRGKEYEEIIKENKNDIYRICNLDLDMRKKLNMCLMIDKMLYTKYIRNENQQPYNFR